jgi:hypothetical protein
MLRLCILLLILSGFDAVACRAAKQISGAIDMNYLEVLGTYSIKLPARIGKSNLATAGLFYKKFGSTEYDSGEFGTDIILHLEGDNLIGEFNAFSKTGYEAWIFVRWNGLYCPVISRKKVKLFPKNA